MFRGAAGTSSLLAFIQGLGLRGFQGPEQAPISTFVLGIFGSLNTHSLNPKKVHPSYALVALGSRACSQKIEPSFFVAS